MEPIVKSKPAFTIIGLQFRGTNENNACPKLWDKFLPRMADLQPLLVEPVTAFGVCSDFDMKVNIFTYTVGLEVKDSNTIPNEMVSMEIPEQEYAIFETTLPSIMQTFEMIYKNWLPKSEYIRAGGPEFELYDTDFNPEIADSKMYIYVPVLKK